MEDNNLIPVFIDKSTEYKESQIVRIYSFVVTIEESSTQYPTGDPKRLPDVSVSDFKQLSSAVIWLDSAHRFILSTTIDELVKRKVEAPRWLWKKIRLSISWLVLLTVQYCGCIVLLKMNSRLSIIVREPAFSFYLITTSNVEGQLIKD